MCRLSAHGVSGLLWLLPALPFAAEEVVIVLGEAVGFVADVLEQAQRERMVGEFQGPVRSRQVDFLFLLGEREKRRRGDLLVPEGGQGGGELPLAPVDEEDVGEDFVLVAEAAVA